MIPIPSSTYSLPRMRFSIALRVPALFGLGTGVAFAVAAQTAAAPPDTAASASPPAPVVMNSVTVTGRRAEGYTVDDSTSATKLNLSPRETPQSITVITRERLDDQDLTSLRKVLDNTPGIYSNAYDSERVLFYSRGFLIDSLMYDGVPALSNFNTGSIDETLDTSLYERIEVVRGATGLMTGAGSPAASINLVRKHADSKTPTVSLDLSVGSWRAKRAELDATVPLTADGRIRARGVAVIEDGDSYQALYHKRKYVFSGIVDADLTTATHVSLGFDYQDNQPRANTWGSFPLFYSDGRPTDWSRSVTTAADWAYWNRKTQTVFGEVRHTFDNGWALRSTLSHREYKEDVALFYMFGFPDATTGAGLDPSAYRSKSKITENSLDIYASGPFDLFDRKHELVVGYNGSRAKNVGKEQNQVEETLPPTTGNFAQWDGTYPQPAFQDPTPLNDIKTDQDAIYAAGRFTLTDSLKLIAGARYSRVKVDSFDVYGDPVNSKYDFSKAIPYAGLVWDFLPEFSAFTSYTGIFKPQSNRDASGRYLDPVEGKSVEIGIKGEHFDHQLNTAITLFETRQNNIAAPLLDPVSGEPVLFPDGSSVSKAIDGTRTRGFEIEAAGRIARDVQGSIGWTRNVTKDGDGQSIRTFIPSTLVRLFVTWEPKRWIDRLTLGAGVNWQSESSTPVAAPEGAVGRRDDGTVELRQGSLAEISLMARYAFTKNLSLQFNANNLFDKKYYVLDQYDNTYYGSPASYALTLRASY